MKIDLGSTSLEDLSAFESRLQTDLIAGDGGYYDFFKAAWPHVEPRPYVDEAYVKFLCDHMELLMKGKLSSNRLLINIPPGHSKSMIMVVMSLPYLWTLDPTAYAIYAHKSQDIMRDMARKTRTVIQSSWYQDRWPVKILDDAKKVDRFMNDQNGGRVGVTVRQQITGSHAKGKFGGLICIDDPDRPDDTETDNTEVGRWYREVLPTRFASLARSQICIVQQRISQKDLSAHVLDSGEDYTHVCLPMHFDPDRKCVTEVGEDWRTEPGELLSPLRNSEEDIDRLREVFGDPRLAEAQLEQLPVAQDGSIFKTDYFESRYDVLPPHVQYTVSCDLTFTGAKTSDWAVLEVWARGLNNGKHYKVEEVRRKMGFVETAQEILALGKKYPRSNLLIEKTANGFATVEILVEAGVDKNRIHEFKVGRNSKQARASTVSYLFDRGDVKYPRKAPWLDDYIKEMTSFPSARYDDRVDCTCNYLAWITGSKPVDLATAFRYAGTLARNLRR